MDQQATVLIGGETYEVSIERARALVMIEESYMGATSPAEEFICSVLQTYAIARMVVQGDFQEFQKSHPEYSVRKHGLTPDEVERHLEDFRENFEWMKLGVAYATRYYPTDPKDTTAKASRRSTLTVVKPSAPTAEAAPAGSDTVA